MDIERILLMTLLFVAVLLGASISMIFVGFTIHIWKTVVLA